MARQTALKTSRPMSWGVELQNLHLFPIDEPAGCSRLRETTAPSTHQDFQWAALAESLEALRCGKQLEPAANLLCFCEAFDVSWAAFSEFWYEAAAEASAPTESLRWNAHTSLSSSMPSVNRSCTAFLNCMLSIAQARSIAKRHTHLHKIDVSLVVATATSKARLTVTTQCVSRAQAETDCKGQESLAKSGKGERRVELTQYPKC